MKEYNKYINKIISEGYERRMEVVDVREQLDKTQQELLDSVVSKIENVWNPNIWEIRQMTSEELEFILDLEELYDGVEEIEWLNKLASLVKTFLQRKTDEPEEI